ncbi:MAG TPA: hypothetical protein VIG41_11925 [Micrococcaceae bacterium]|jgi:hypothetical protein
MNLNAPLRQLRKVFFAPVDQNRIQQSRDHHERMLQEMNISNLR